MHCNVQSTIHNVIVDVINNFNESWKSFKDIPMKYNKLITVIIIINLETCTFIFVQNINEGKWLILTGLFFAQRRMFVKLLLLRRTSFF